MCGIVGVLGSDRAEVEGCVRAALPAMRHRGPDDYGHATVQLGSQWLSVAHRRLSIIDTSEAGRQPMIRGPLPEGSRATRVPTVSGDDGVGIVFNGEIYNFPELYPELAKGSPPQPFRSHCDTEAIVHGVARFGIDYVKLLRGMYTFALWEPATARLHLVRDRLGIKPLYYAQAGDRVVFGSEVRSLLATGLLRRKIDPVGLEGFLTFGSVQDPNILIEGVQAVEPSHTITFERGRAERRRYWQIPTAVNASITHGEAKEETARLVGDAVKSHMLADVRVGAFLSGGVDSSIVVGLMAQADAGPLHAVTVVSDNGGAEIQKEADCASLVARRYGAEHHVVRLSAAMAETETRRAVTLMDQPSVDGPNTFIVSEAARKAGCIVALSGLGADEVFGGYSSFRSFAGLRWVSGLAGMNNAGSLIRDRSGLGQLRRAKLGDLLASGGNLAALAAAQRTMFVSPVRNSLVRPEFRAPAGAEIAPVLAEEESPRDALNYLAAYELRGYLRNMLLRDCDGMSMAHSLEVRVPFLDHKLIEFALSLPGSMRSTVFRGKALLREAMQPVLPKEIDQRRKIGFNLAIPQWMRTSLRPTMEAALLRDHPVLNSKTVATMWQTFIMTGDESLARRLWALFALSEWLDRHVFETAQPLPESRPVAGEMFPLPQAAVG